jgi:hypothetical protein
MWPRPGDRSACCVRAKTGCGSSWPCVTVMTISVCPMRVYAGPCPSPSRPTAAAQPPSGGLGHRPWRRGSPPMSGRRVRCCSFVSRRGDSQQRCGQALVVGSVRGGDLSGRCVSARPASRLSPGVRGPLGCYESFLLYTFLSQRWSTDEPEVFTRSGRVYDRLLWLNGFTCLEIILAQQSRSAQEGPFHYDLSSAVAWDVDPT